MLSFKEFLDEGLLLKLAWGLNNLMKRGGKGGSSLERDLAPANFHSAKQATMYRRTKMGGATYTQRAGGGGSTLSNSVGGKGFRMTTSYGPNGTSQINTTRMGGGWIKRQRTKEG